MKVGTRLGIGVLLMMAMLVAIGPLWVHGIGAINDRIIEKDWVKADAANTINIRTWGNTGYTQDQLIANRLQS